MKNCTNTKCTQINPQPLKNFTKDRDKKDGLRTQCKFCRSISRKFHKLRPKVKTQRSIVRKAYNSDLQNKDKKYCSREDCKIEGPQPLKNFNVDKRRKSGLRTDCRDCQGRYNEEWIEVPGNRDKTSEYLKIKRQEPEFKLYMAEYRKIYFSDPENKAARTEYHKNYYENELKNEPDYIAKISEYNRIRNSTPEMKIKLAEKQKVYTSTPIGRANANAAAAKRRTAKAKATPPWLTEAQFKEIGDIYKECVLKTIQTGIKHHVDHIIPIQGKNVRGLHVPWNLRILPATENQRKFNKLLPE